MLSIDILHKFYDIKEINKKELFMIRRENIFFIPKSEVFDSRTGFVSLQTAMNNFIEGRQCGAAYRADSEVIDSKNFI